MKFFLKRSNLELEFLELSENAIAEIPVGFLRSLKKLKSLSLRANQIGDLSLDWFTPQLLPQLQVRFKAAKNERLSINNFFVQMLDLSHNQLDQLRPSIFGGAAALTHLNLSANRLHRLDSAPFDGAHRHSIIQSLDLSNNRLTNLTHQVFSRTPALIALNLSSNLLSEVPSRVFASQRHLKHLDLSANLLIRVAEDAFADLYSLKALNLARNLVGFFLPTLKHRITEFEWFFVPKFFLF